MRIWTDSRNGWTVHLNDDNTVRIVSPLEMSLAPVDAISFSIAISTAAWAAIERERKRPR